MIGPYLVVDLSGGFRLHLLVFPFVYLFHSRIEASLDSRMELVHHLQMTTSEGFQHHFNIISNFFCCVCYMKKNVAFTLISFAVLSFELPVVIPVQLHLELEVN